MRKSKIIMILAMVMPLSIMTSQANNVNTTLVNKKVNTIKAGLSNNPPRGQISHKFTNAAGSTRSYFVTLPRNYIPTKKYKLMLVFVGTDGTGKQMQEWVGKGWSAQASGLEINMPDTIFIYPDPKYKWYDEENDTFNKGWELGPYGDTYEGTRDLKFIQELLTLAKQTYSIDNSKVFATGQSWGGDMTAVTGCFLGDQFAAIAPVAANEPHWFHIKNNEWVTCKGKPAVWTWFGEKDEHFANQGLNTNGENGRKQNDFWIYNHQCDLNKIQRLYETDIYTKCKVAPVRLTIYGPDQYSGDGDLPNHYQPDYYYSEVSKWFNKF